MVRTMLVLCSCALNVTMKQKVGLTSINILHVAARTIQRF